MSRFLSPCMCTLVTSTDNIVRSQSAWLTRIPIIVCAAYVFYVFVRSSCEWMGFLRTVLMDGEEIATSLRSDLQRSTALPKAIVITEYYLL